MKKVYCAQFTGLLISLVALQGYALSNDAATVTLSNTTNMALQINADGSKCLSNKNDFNVTLSNGEKTIVWKSPNKQDCIGSDAKNLKLRIHFLYQGKEGHAGFNEIRGGDCWKRTKITTFKPLKVDTSANCKSELKIKFYENK